MIIREAGETDIDAVARLLADDGLGRGRETPGDPAYARAFRAMSAQRGQGIGEALFEAAFERAAAPGCTPARLTTDRGRADALRFYQRLGFEPTH